MSSDDVSPGEDGESPPDHPEGRGPDRERPDAGGSPPGLDGALRTRDDPQEADEEPDDGLGENIFDGATERGPIEPGTPDVENALFVALGVLGGTLVILRLLGAV